MTSSQGQEQFLREGASVSRRVAATIGIALLTVTIGASGAGASGGGGCPPPITNGSETKALIKGWCFEPTVTYIRPGDTVTWVNKDPVPHTVTGANRAWGSYDKLKAGKRLSYTFDLAGTYPYYCVYHPGMVGTVVVWDGEFSDLLGPREAPDSVHRVKPADAVAASTAVPNQKTQPDEGGTSLAIVAMGAPAALGLWILARRTRRRTSS
jgi:plastocyanin